MNKRKLQLKLMLVLGGFGIICSVGISILIYLQYHNYIISSLRNTLRDAGKLIETQMPVLGEVDYIRQEGIAASEAYMDILKELQEYRKAFGFSFVYLIENNSEGFIFLLDTKRLSKNIDMTFLTDYNEMTKFFSDVVKNKQTRIFDIYTDRFGTFMSAFVPVIRQDKVVSIIGLDYEVSLVRSLQRRSLLQVIFILIITIIFVIILARVISIAFTKLVLENELMQSRIATMLSQIQPHFLYNALAVISRLCDKDPSEAKKATVNFSNYLRANMNLLERTEPIPFENELNHTICFMNLEKAMYGEALNVIYDIQAKDFNLPALTMQPIVENAVKHGIGKKEGGGTVAISAKKTESGYQIIISDDGTGFDTEKIAYDGDSHIGISNVRFRLSSQCGGTLDIESKLRKGTTAKIFIPKTGSLGWGRGSK